MIEVNERGFSIELSDPRSGCSSTRFFDKSFTFPILDDTCI